MRGVPGGKHPTALTVVGLTGSFESANERGPNDRVMYQTRVSSFVSNSLDVTAQAVMSADRRSMRLSVSPVFAPLAVRAYRRAS